MSIRESRFGRTSDGRPVRLFEIENGNGACAEFTDFGAALVRLRVPDGNGCAADVVAGYDNARGYIVGDAYAGATVGRYANRIRNGRFVLDGVEYVLRLNDGQNHLHGGIKGFSHRIWDAKECRGGIEFSLFSADGEEGYPGNLRVTVRFELLSDPDALCITYFAETDKKTILNLTNHSYFNLNGGFETVLNHILRIDAEKYIPTDEFLIPEGEPKDVFGTPFDFTKPKKIGKDIFRDSDDLRFAHGYDHCFWFRENAEQKNEKYGLPCRCTLVSEESGREMRLFTDRPCVQVYTANFVSDASVPFRGNSVPKKRCAVCLETGLAPDSPNRKDFKFSNPVLNPFESFVSKTVYAFRNI